MTTTHRYIHRQPDRIVVAQFSWVAAREFSIGAVCVLAIGLALTTSAIAAPLQWPVASGGNNHWYDVVNSGFNIPWPTAKNQAASLSFVGLPGHLATITSQAENDFLALTFGDSIRAKWLGGFQPPGSVEPAGNWQWITGEPFSYTNWEPTEPNNSGGNEDSLDFATASLRPPGVWNDLNGASPPVTFVNGYVVEYERVPEPSTLALAALAIPAALLYVRRKLRR